MSYPNSWNKAERTTLARFVPTDLGDQQVRLPKSALDYGNNPTGRVELVRALYEGFAAADIHYALEAWNPESHEQTIRQPSEILDGPGKGTCLDLALLFAAQCLSVKLLPVVVVTRTHAFVLVSLEVGADEPDAYRRTDARLFTSGEITDCHDWLAGLVDRGAYIAVETTGFAHVTSLDPGVIMGEGRTDGRMAFEQATAAGRNHLAEGASGQVEFALDIAWAHSRHLTPKWPEGPVQVGPYKARPHKHGTYMYRDLREVFGQRRNAMVIYSGNVVGRSAEKRVLQTIAPGQLVGVQGRPGTGKSFLLKWLGNEASPGLDDTTIFLRYKGGGPLDILQKIFELCFDSEQQISMADAIEALAPIPGRVLLDDVDELTDIEIQTLRDALACWGIAISAATETSKSLGFVTTISPLAPDEAIEIFEQHAGSLSDELKSRMSRAIADLELTPGRLAGLATKVTTGELTTDGVLSALAAPEPEPDPGGDVADLLKAAAPAYVPVDLIHDAITRGRPAVAKDLSDLVTAGLAESGSPRYRWLGPNVHDFAAEGRLVDAVIEWMRERPSVADRVAAEPSLVLRAALLAEAHDRPEDVIRIARIADGPLAASRRWGAWGELLGRAQIAATSLGNISALAWTQHQLGSRSMGLGNEADARARLEWARDARSSLGESAASAVSKHNLDLLPPVVPSAETASPDLDPGTLAQLRFIPAPPPTGLISTPPFPDLPQEPEELDNILSGLARWGRKHPLIPGLVALVGTVGVLALLCALGAFGLCGGPDPPPPPPPLDLSPTAFACSLDTDLARVGDAVLATVIVEPPDLGLQVKIESGPFSAEFIDSGNAFVVQQEPGTYDVVASWEQAGGFATAACGSVEISEPEPPAEPTTIECTRQPVGEVAVNQNVELTVEWLPSELELDIVFRNGDDSMAIRAEEKSAVGFYLEADTYQPTVTWSNGSNTSTIPCGDPVIVIADEPEPILTGRCAVTPTELETGEQFLITAFYEPASLNPQITISHGDDFSEPANSNDQAQGFYLEPGVYTPRITFTTQTQIITINCPQITATKWRCAVTPTELETGEQFLITAFYEPASLNPQITINHGDDFSEPANSNDQAQGFYLEPGVYTPRITFITRTQTITINCPQITARPGTPLTPGPDPDCPAGFDLFTDGSCVRFVKPLPTEGPTDSICGEGILLGTSCVITGLPPIRGPATCPVSENVFGEAGGCYTIVGQVDGQCPAGTVEDSGPLCRRPVDTAPGPFVCADGFGLVDGTCLRFEAPAQVARLTTYYCPDGTIGNPTSPDDFCRESVPAGTEVPSF